MIAELRTSQVEATTLAASLRPIQHHLPDNPFNSIDPADLDFNELVELRAAHQTKQAQSGVRNLRNPSAESDTEYIRSKQIELSD